jgi:hypothetical protein
MNDKQSLTPGQQARVAAALDAWYDNPGGSDYRVPGAQWDTEEMQRMHAALEAPTAAAALEAFGAAPGTWLSTPAQDARNLATMTALREHLGSRTLAGQADPEGLRDILARSGEDSAGSAVTGRPGSEPAETAGAALVTADTTEMAIGSRGQPPRPSLDFPDNLAKGVPGHPPADVSRGRRAAGRSIASHTGQARPGSTR